MENLDEFIDLIKRYESITIEEIKSNYNTTEKFNSRVIASRLTGFGWDATCTLCKVIAKRCNKCIYSTYYDYSDYDDQYCTFDSTYYNIKNSNSPEQLKEAFEKRAKFMRKVLSELGIDDIDQL